MDGGWWPRSLDLGAELVPLIDELATSGYDIRRVVYNLYGWQSPPTRLTVGRRLVKLRGYRTQNSASIGLIDTSGWDPGNGVRLELLVVPPDADPTFAERALAMAAQDGDTHTAPDLLWLAAS